MELMERTNTEQTILGGLNFDNTQAQNGELVVASKNEVEAFTDKYKMELRKDPQVQQLTNEINVTDMNSVLVFGEKSANGINQVSERLLNSIKRVNQEEAGEVLNKLNSIMKNFDIDEFQNQKDPNFFEKVFKKVKNSVEAMLSKYDSMGKEVQDVYMILKRYEAEIMQEGKNLNELYAMNVQYYQELEKYIVAGELALEELDTVHIPKYEKEAMESGDSLAQQNLNTLKMCRDMVDSRIYDLRMAEGVAIQSLPMIQSMQRGNFDLIRTIKSSFIVTLPIFKQCLINAVSLKRQELMAKNIDAIRNTTNELIQRNAQAVSRQSVELAKMSGRGALDIDALKNSFNTIMQGIEETKRVQEENRVYRENGTKELEAMKYKALTQKDVNGNNSNIQSKTSQGAGMLNI